MLDALCRRLRRLAVRCLRACRIQLSDDWYYLSLRRLSVTGPSVTRPQPSDSLKTWFDYVLFSDIWSETECRDFGMAFVQLDTRRQACLTAALLLSAQVHFDRFKLSFLLDLVEHAPEEVAVRALTAVVILSFQWPALMAEEPSMCARWSLMMEEPAQKDALCAILCQLIREQSTDSVSSRMRNEILPEMTRFGHNVQDKLEEGLSQDELDLKELFEDSGMSEKMMEFQQMQSEGVDVYLSTFEQLKHFSFFNEICHWFLPFDPHQPDIAELFDHPDASASGIRLDQILGKLDFLCDSDKYSFCLNLLQIPADMRSKMAAGMGADGESFSEMMDMERNGSARPKRRLVSLHFIQDMYRFYVLFRKTRAFQDVFRQNFRILDNPWLAPVLEGEEEVSEMASVYLNNRHVLHARRAEELSDALALYDFLLKKHPGNFDWLRRAGFCHQQLRQYREAIECYAKADLIRPDNLLTMRRMASCYHQLGQLEPAMEIYTRVCRMDDKNLSVCLNLAKCQMEAHLYQEALNNWYRAELMSGEPEKTRRPIAWCSLMLDKLDTAWQLYDTLLKDHPTAVDCLNAGHTAWLMHQPAKALDCYVKAVRELHTDPAEMLRLFDGDVSVLFSKGISRQDIRLMRDAMQYGWEEGV